MKLRYSAQARTDLKAIRAYIARDSPLNAKRFVKRLRAAIERLASFPASGGVLEDWDQDDLRQLIVGNYRVVYRVTAKVVLIRTVVHAARQVPEPPGE